jgi:tetratricopeptide (TPR) repeat protein
VSASLWAGELTPEQRRRVETTMVELQFSMRAFVSYRACLRRIHAEDPEFLTRLVISIKPVPLILILLSLVLPVGTSAHTTAPGTSSAPIALERGLGTLHHPVSTRNAQAQAYFDQGLKLIFAFNHEEAIRSFQRAVELDSDLAMAHWGIALALGPNINQSMSPDAHKMAYTEAQKALALKSNASVAEQAYIDALAKRYSANPDADRQPLQTAYMNAMKNLVRSYP